MFRTVFESSRDGYGPRNRGVAPQLEFPWMPHFSAHEKVRHFKILEFDRDRLWAHNLCVRILQ